jgi:Tol biopolymer transport system component
VDSPEPGRCSIRPLVAVSLALLVVCGRVGAAATARAVSAGDASSVAATAAAPGAGVAAPSAPPQIKGAYFGQAPPGETPELFAPGILASVSEWVEATEFSPDGTRCLLGVGDSSYSSARLLCSERVNDVWTPFAAPSFTTGFLFSHEPVFSADGNTLTFTGRKADGAQDLWTVPCANRAWGAPVALPPPIHSDDRQWRGSTTSDGTLYFGRAHSEMNQVFRAYRDSTRKLLVEQLGAPINTQSYEGDPCVAPDGRFLVFYSGRGGLKTRTDLFACFADGRGGWGTPINLGPAFNSPDDEYGAHLSADGRYLFFTRHTSLGNRIYWVSTSAVEKLKPLSSK